MTTSEGARSSAERPAAQAQTAPGSGLSRAATGADARETAPLTGVAAPPDDLRRLEAEIERTREQLGATVQELAARADVKTRAQAKVAEVTGRVKSTTAQARTKAAARAGSVRGQVTGTTTAARQKAISAGGAGRDQLRGRAAAVGGPVWDATPEPVRSAVTKGASGARERWVPLTVAAGVLVVGYVALTQWRRRYSNAPSHR
jgi:Protein of unknown function (DUF3618)